LRDWPNPLPKNLNLELRTWIETLPPGIVAKTIPKAQWDWPNPIVPIPRPPSVDLRTWTDSLPPGSIGATIPKAQLDWPNPTPDKARSQDLRFWSQALPPGEVAELTVSADGLIESVTDVEGVGEAASSEAPIVEQPSGGWFNVRYEQELRRRAAKRAKQRKLDEETAAIPQPVDREIGLLLREQEAKEQKREELERLRDLAVRLDAERARLDYGERVSKALERAVQKGNYSALEALDREIQRAQEEEESAMLAITLLIGEDD
jgi:hypothetical protein